MFAQYFEYYAIILRGGVFCGHSVIHTVRCGKRVVHSVLLKVTHIVVPIDAACATSYYQ